MDDAERKRKRNEWARQRKLKWKAAGLCSRCGKSPRAPGKMRCYYCIQQKRNYDEQYAATRAEEYAELCRMFDSWRYLAWVPQREPEETISDVIRMARNNNVSYGYMVAKLEGSIWNLNNYRDN